MSAVITINNHPIGPGYPTYIVAEMSANHNQSFERAIKIIEAAKESGADAVKLQTYTPDTITIDCDNEYFQIKGGTLWDGRNLYNLYGEAYTPWEWQPKLKEVADKLGLDLFSTPFDPTAVDFLEQMNVPAYKVASSEVVDLPLIQKIAATGKPVIMSTGMATLGEIDAAVKTVRETGNHQLTLLKCTAAYPALPQEMNLRTIPHLAETFDAPVGLSDHTRGIESPIVAVGFGACLIEKHFTLSGDDPGPDSAFSLDPQEFKAMVEAVRTAEKALGKIRYGISGRENISQKYRRSLFIVANVQTGEEFTAKNVRSIRPGQGLPPGSLSDVIGRQARRNLKKGTPLRWDMIE